MANWIGSVAKQPMPVQELLLGSVALVLIVMIVAVAYIAYSRKYRLNWFEQTQLDAEKTAVIKLTGTKSYYSSGSSCSGSAHDLGAFDDESSPVHKPRDQEVLSVHSNGSSCSGASVVQHEFWVPHSVQPSETNQSGGAEASPTSSPRPKLVTMYDKLDHTKINTDMYKRQEEYPPTDAGLTGCRIHFCVSYNAAFSVLSVRVQEVRAILTARKTADTFVRLRLIPDQEDADKIRESHVHRNTLDPQFEEEFAFKDVSVADLSTKILEILLFDKISAEGKDELLGGVHWPLEQMIDFVRETVRSIALWKLIDPPQVLHCDNADYGELLLSANYLPSAERLTVTLVKAKRLKKPDGSSKKPPDVACKLILQTPKCAGRPGVIKKKKRTAVQRQTSTPSFNEAFTFHLSSEAFNHFVLTIVLIHDRSTTQFLGQNKDLPLGQLVLTHDHPSMRRLLDSKTALWQRLTVPEDQSNFDH